MDRKTILAVLALYAACWAPSMYAVMAFVLNITFWSFLVSLVLAAMTFFTIIALDQWIRAFLNSLGQHEQYEEYGYRYAY